MTTHTNEKIQEFQEAGSAIISAIAAPEKEIHDLNLTNLFEIKAGKEGENRELQIKGGGVESISGTSGTALTASIFEALRAKDKERRDSTGRLITFLSMLEDIDRQIAALDGQIAQYETELGELKEELSAMEELRELVENGELDPTNPDHIRLLKQSGIPEDQWGVITPTMLDDHIKDTKTRIEELEEKIRKAKDTRTKLEDKRDNIYEKMEDNPESRADPETVAKAAEARQDFYDIERELSESESEWFIRCVNNAPQSDWDGLIEQLSDRTFDEMLNNENISLSVRDYMIIHNFIKEFETSCEDVPQEEHRFVLQDMLENYASTEEITALVRSEDTPDYIKATMNEISIENKILTQDQNLDLRSGIDQ